MLPLFIIEELERSRRKERAERPYIELPEEGPVDGERRQPEARDSEMERGVAVLDFTI